MKKIVCLLMMLFALVGVSNAEVIEAGISYPKTSRAVEGIDYSLPSYTYDDIVRICQNYPSAPEEYQSEFDLLFSAIKDAEVGIDSYVGYSNSSGYGIVCFYNSSLGEFTMARYNGSIVYNGFIGYDSDSTFSLLTAGRENSYSSSAARRSFFTTYTPGFDPFIYKYNESYQMVYSSDKSIKIVDVTSSDATSGYTSTWDGESYYYQASSEPEEPDVSSVDLAGLISAITSSSVVQDNKGFGKDEYFIIPFGEGFGKKVYEVYFYASHLNLSQFEYLNSDRYYYDLNKTSVDGILGTIADFFVGDNVKGTYFTVVYDSESDSYGITYNGKFEFNDDYLSFLDSELNPIVYTTKNISYYLYEKTSDGVWVALPDESKNIVNKVVVDSEGSEISPIVSGSSSLVSETPWDRFINAIQSVGITVLEGIKKIFIPDFMFIGNQLNLITQKFVIIGEAREKFSELVNTIQLAENTPPVITLNFGNAESSIWGDGSAVCFDLSWYSKFKPTVDFIIIVFTYGFFFYRLVRIIPDLLQGASSAPDIAHDIISTSIKNERIRADRMKHSKGG